MADKYTWEKQEVEEEGCEWWWPQNWTTEGVKSVVYLAIYGYVSYKVIKKCNEMSV